MRRITVPLRARPAGDGIALAFFGDHFNLGVAGMSYRRSTLAAIAALMVIALATGCNNSTGPLAPFQPQINNITDDFQFQATGVTNVTWTFTYKWLNSGDSATVNQATTLTTGTAVLTISDSTGHQLYSQSLSANGTFGMTKGIHGHWTIKVAFVNYSGTVNFRVQKQ